MKVLPLDIKNCHECPCSICETGWLGDVVRVVCQVKGKYCTEYDMEMPEWCPVKTVNLKTPNGSDVFNEYVRGWNDCVREIEND